jgi:hypothetical protein
VQASKAPYSDGFHTYTMLWARDAIVSECARAPFLCATSGGWRLWVCCWPPAANAVVLPTHVGEGAHPFWVAAAASASPSCSARGRSDDADLQPVVDQLWRCQLPCTLRHVVFCPAVSRGVVGAWAAAAGGMPPAGL